MSSKHLCILGDKDVAVLAHSSLFSQMSAGEIEQMVQALGGYTKEYLPTDIICSPNRPFERTGILLSGSLDVTHMSVLGRSAVMHQVRIGQAFGGQANLLEMSIPHAEVVAAQKSRILLFDMRLLFNVSRITQVPIDVRMTFFANLAHAQAQECLQLKRHIRVLAQRSVQGKIAYYLLALSEDTQSKVVTLPFSRSGFASYLCVNRSVLSRELWLMHEAGLIDIKDRRITLSDVDGLIEVIPEAWI